MSDKTVIGKIECSNCKSIISFNIDEDPLEELNEGMVLAIVTVESGDELEEKEYQIAKKEAKDLEKVLNSILNKIKGKFSSKNYEEIEEFVLEVSEAIDEELRN